MTSPISNPESYDFFTLDGTRHPGRSMISSGGEREEEWQDQKAPGTAGAFTVFRGEQLSKVSYKIILWEEAHFNDWKTFAAMMDEGKGRRPNPRVYTLVDLRLSHNKITSVSFAKFGAQEQLGPGRWAYELILKEIKKRKPIGGPALGPRNENEKAIEAQRAKNDALRVQRDAALAAARAGK